MIASKSDFFIDFFFLILYKYMFMAPVPGQITHVDKNTKLFLLLSFFVKFTLIFQIVAINHFCSLTSAVTLPESPLSNPKPNIFDINTYAKFELNWLINS